MKQNRELIYKLNIQKKKKKKPQYTYSADLWKRSKGNADERLSVQLMILEQLDIHMQRNESEQRPCTLHKMDKGSKCKMKNSQTPIK